jgi:hypothetical protein
MKAGELDRNQTKRPPEAEATRLRNPCQLRRGGAGASASVIKGANLQRERGDTIQRDLTITTVSPPPVPLKLNALLVRSISPPDWAWTLNRRRRLSPSPASPRARGDE